MAAIGGSLILLISLLFRNISNSIWRSLILSTLTLFVVGDYQTRTIVGHSGKSGLEMAAIGTVSALAAS